MSPSLWVQQQERAFRSNRSDLAPAQLPALARERGTATQKLIKELQLS